MERILIGGKFYSIPKRQYDTIQRILHKSLEKQKMFFLCSNIVLITRYPYGTVISHTITTEGKITRKFEV